MNQDEVKKVEKSFFFYRVKNLYFCEYKLDSIIRKEKDNAYVYHLMHIFSGYRFFTYVKYSKIGKCNKIYTFLRIDADGADIFKAFVFSIILKNELDLKSDLSNKEYIELIKEKIDKLKTIDTKELINSLYELDWNTHFLNLEDVFSRYQIM